MLTLWSGSLSDKIGRVRTFSIGYVILFICVLPVWMLIDQANIWMFAAALIVFVPGLALSYGPQSALYAEMFPRSVRFSGVSVGYALGAILGGAFAPMIAELLMDTFGGTWAIGMYLMLLCAISLVALAVTPRDLEKQEL